MSRPFRPRPGPRPGRPTGEVRRSKPVEKQDDTPASGEATPAQPEGKRSGWRPQFGILTLLLLMVAGAGAGETLRRLMRDQHPGMQRLITIAGVIALPATVMVALGIIKQVQRLWRRFRRWRTASAPASTEPRKNSPWD